jgi:ABC-type antimicrobial peptide transport system permease subunit
MELGIRVALGARPSDVQRLALRQGLAPVAAGLAIGVVLALAVGRVLASLLFQVRPSDPVTIALVALVLGAVAVVACWLPARRVSRVPPVVALREE